MLNYHLLVLSRGCLCDEIVGEGHTHKFHCLVKSYKDECIMKLRDVGFHLYCSTDHCPDLQISSYHLLGHNTTNWSS